MVYSWLARILSALLALRTGLRRAERDKDVEILLLRYQRRMLQRRLNHKPRPSRREKLVLAALVAKLKRLKRGMEQIARAVDRLGAERARAFLARVQEIKAGAVRCCPMAAADA